MEIQVFGEYNMTKNFTSRAGLMVCSALVSSCFMAGVALAQSASGEGSGLEEIVVTAQKREQNLQDVPVAVTAISQASLQVNRVTNVMDLNGLAPGLSARQNAGSLGSPSYTMRGVFASASVPAQDRQISSYIDGVYVGGTRGSVFDLPDLERVEVLRGPQGTLFGRNATAGAVSIVTRDPGGEFKFRQEVTVGNLSQLRTRTTIDSPQMGILSAYVTYVHDERRGDVRNLGADTVFDRTSPVQNVVGRTVSPKWLGSKNAENIFVAVKLAPSDAFSLTYKFDYSNNQITPEARATLVINPNDFVGGALSAIYAAQTPGGGAFGPVPLHPDFKRPDATNNAWTMPGFVKSSGHNLTLKWQATDNLSIKNITSYRQTEALGITTIMGLSGLEYTAAAKAFFTAPQVFLGGASYAQALGADGNAPVGSYFAGYEGQGYGKYWQVSNELQANYQSDLLTLTVGGIWFHSHELSSAVPGFAANVAFTPVASLLTPGNVQETIQNTTSIAAYGQAEVHVTEQFDVVVGARITSDKKDNDFTFGGTYNAAQNTISGATLSRNPYKKTKPSFSVGLNYKVNDDVLTYAKFSTAFLSGGTAGPLSFEPETVSSWEAGLKSEWFDRRLRFNAALFLANYKHSQSAQSGTNVADPNDPTKTLSQFGVVVIDNGSIRAKGVELEVSASPVTGLGLGATFSYTDTEWLSPSPLLTSNGLHPAAPNGIPAYTGAVNAQYVTPPLFGDATMLFRIDGIYQGKYRNSALLDNATTNPVFAPYEFTPARWIWNGRVALRDIPVGPLKGEIGLWGRNLANNRDPVYTLLFGTIQANASYQQARTLGADFIVSF
jgi:iron complex outermembrane recepter protein